MKQTQKLGESLYKFRETLKSLKQGQPINNFEYPELIEFWVDGSINYKEQIRQVEYCKKLCLQRLRELKVSSQR